MRVIRYLDKSVLLSDLISTGEQCREPQVLEYVHLPVHTRFSVARNQETLMTAALVGDVEP